MSYKETCLNPESIRNEICHRYDPFLCILLWKSFPKAEVVLKLSNINFHFENGLISQNFLLKQSTIIEYLFTKEK